MSHPFFNALKYPFHRPDGIAFYNALKNSIKAPNAILLLYEQCQDDLPDLATDGVPPGQIWQAALHNLVANDALFSLCELVKSSVRGKLMQEAIAAVVAAKGEENVLLLSNGIVVLDRTNLRQYLAELASEQTNLRVLVVKGEAGSGKSHSKYLFEYLAHAKGAIAVHICMDLVVTVEDAIETLYAAIGAPSQCLTWEEKHTTKRAWYSAVCTHLLGIITKISTERKSRIQLWIAVDDLGVDSNNAPHLDRHIRDFFDQFALHMKNPAFRDYFRLMLIDYPDDPVLSKWDRFTWKVDSLSADSIGEQDVVLALQAWAKEHRKNLFEHDIQTHATQVIATAEASSRLGASRVGCIADELQKILEVL
jgi:hypothetical protein